MLKREGESKALERVDEREKREREKKYSKSARKVDTSEFIPFVFACSLKLSS